MGSNLSDMGRGELCHDRLTDRMQDVGTTKPNMRPRCTGSGFKCGDKTKEGEKIWKVNL